MFARDNPVFRDTLLRREPGRRHRFVVFVDANVAASFPSLAHDIAGYAGVHAEAMELVSHPESVPGGEHVKNDPALGRTKWAVVTGVESSTKSTIGRKPGIFSISCSNRRSCIRRLNAS